MGMILSQSTVMLIIDQNNIFFNELSNHKYVYCKVSIIYIAVCKLKGGSEYHVFELRRLYVIKNSHYTL